ncbi:hypothetical protein Hamer_G014064 [Homarus americanus]|uniref:Tesmin/TSO1-like CXC domain-containing protein n=1 Tax=Homarus americanus TaxID=6706 RepID=A0A8J5MRK9_HOMAM|nr:hypothetical protein Hamer_G014064 [Homarus americanus]
MMPCSHPWLYNQFVEEGYHTVRRTVASGLTATEGDDINCDETQKIGLEIQHSMDNQPVSDATIKRSQMDHLTRKIDKSELVRKIQMDLTNLNPKAEAQQLQQGTLVIDGGWLLHYIRRRKNATYSQVLKQYSSFLGNRHEDTDVFIMLLYHWNICMADILLRKECRRSNAGQMYNMREAYGRVTVEIRKHILFIHAWSGCDTMSATYDQGKTYLMTAEGFVKTTEEVGDAGICLFCLLYGGSRKDTLTTLGCARYMAMMAKSNRVAQQLPPTERAAHYHSLRVHLGNDSLENCTWSWKEVSGSLQPIMADKDAAPSKVLKFKWYKCKQTGKNPRSTNRYSCHKNGLKCVMACAGCRGESCNNTEPFMVIDDETNVLETYKVHKDNVMPLIHLIENKTNIALKGSHFKSLEKKFPKVK